MSKTCLVSGVGFAALLLVASPAQALVVRAWVSGHGNDVAGCGAPTNACRTLQYTHDSIVSAGGEIDILDPAGYGTLTITKAISVVNDGVGTAGVQAASGTAIIINAGPSDAVRLRGLNVEGLGTATIGIVFNTGASLTVEDCTVRDFTSRLVSFVPKAPAYLYVSNTRFEHSGDAVFIQPDVPTGNGIVRAMLERIEATNATSDGVYVDDTQGGTSVGLKVTVADSLVANNTNDGVFAVGTNASVMVRNTTVSDNGNGIETFSGGAIAVARSTLTGNTMAFKLSGSTITTYGDNNVSGTVGATPTAAAFH
jgi:hypothetical protein